MTVRTGGMTHNVIMEDGQFLACAVDVKTAERITRALNGDELISAHGALGTRERELTDLKAKLEDLADELSESPQPFRHRMAEKLRALL